MADDDPAEKHITILRILFLVTGALGFFYLFTVGLLFFAMDVTAKIHEFLVLLILPALFLVAGLVLGIRKWFIWAFALLLSAFLIQYAISMMIGMMPLNRFSLFMMLTYQPVLWELLFGMTLFIYLIIPKVRRYYFG